MSETLKTYLWIGLGSALGGIGRYWLFGVFAQRFQQFPIGTVFVNVTGCFLIGAISAFVAPESRASMQPFARDFLMIGFLGGYTTFSSFSLQTLNLAREGQWLYAGTNVVLSVLLCLVAVWLGHVVGQMLSRS